MSRLLITGIGRSGTKYMAHLLTTSGLPCTHEEVWGTRTFEMPEWTGTGRAEASWPAAAFLSQMDAAVRVVHLVRDPVRWMRSWLLAEVPVLAEGRRVTHRFVDQFCGFDYSAARRVDPFAAAMRLWVDWNKKVEGYATMRLQVEKLTQGDVADMALQIGERLAKANVEAAFLQVPRDTNSDGPTDTAIDWPLLRGREGFESFRAQAVAYGYEETPC